jgi:hypothetical protein
MGVRGVVAAALAAIVSPCFAGPPYVIDDPEPVEPGHVEINLSSINTWSREGVYGTLPHLEVNYGAAENVQLSIFTPLVYDRPDSTGRTEYGYGDTQLSVKLRFIQEDKWFDGCPQVSIYPQVNIPTGDRGRLLGNGQAQVFLPLWLQKSWGEEHRQWTLYGGGGYEFNQGFGNKNFGIFGAVLQRQVTDNLALGFELFHITQQIIDTKPDTGFNVGAVYDFDEHWHLLVSAGRDIWGDNLFTSYTGIQFTY